MESRICGLLEEDPWEVPRYKRGPLSGFYRGYPAKLLMLFFASFDASVLMLKFGNGRKGNRCETLRT